MALGRSSLLSITLLSALRWGQSGAIKQEPLFATAAGSLDYAMRRRMRRRMKTTSCTSTSMAQDSACGFLTDVEGNWEFFNRYVQYSKVLDWSWGPCGQPHLVLRDGQYFVYGGDSVDKGTGDIRVVRQLIALKDRYPDRVQLLIGNRDANKLRFASELTQASLADDAIVNDKSFPYWTAPGSTLTPRQYIDSKGLPDDLASRIKWMLAETMGADGAFERRRIELQELAGGVPQTDDVVVASFISSVTPGHDAWMLEYLKRACVAHVMGSVIFVHGGLTESAIGRVPGSKDVLESPREWVASLNEWATRQVAEYEANPWDGGNSRARAGHGLMDYCVPGGANGASVVCAGHTKGGNPERVPLTVSEYLRKGGITTILCGHTPHGDCPIVQRGGRDGVTVVGGDTSYSDVGAKSEWGVDNRGSSCVSEIIVRPTGRIEVHGALSKGQGEVRYAVSGGDADSDEYVGRALSDGRWVKAKVVDDEGGGQGNHRCRYIVFRGKGRELEVERLDVQEVEKLALPPGVDPAQP